MSLENRSILVTGAGGFIGSHLCERLVELGGRVRAFCHYDARNPYGWLKDSPFLGHFQVVTGDVTDRDSVHDAMQGMENVFHLAALISIPHSYRAPAMYVRTNIEGTLNVMQEALRANVERVVHTSTSEVYGSARFVPMNESHPLQAQSPYAASKIAADKLVEAFHLSFGLPTVTIRPFNTFGPRQSARAVIPTIITQCLTGKNIKLGNIHPTRDMNFVSNTVDGFILAAWKPNVIGQVINLGSGREICIGDLAHLIINKLNCAVSVETDSLRIRPTDSEVDRLLCDNGLARELLDWESRVGLEEGLIRTAQWIEQHIGEYRPEDYTI